MGVQLTPTADAESIWSQETGSVVHEVPLTPTAVMGLHPRPMGTLAPWAAMPASDKIVATPGAPAVVVLSQHAWVCASADVTAARMVAKASLLNCIVKCEVIVELTTGIKSVIVRISILWTFVVIV